MMQNTAFVDAKSYQRKHNRRKAWKNFVRVMACIVVFCTTYALILPAITMEKATFCGQEAHVHEEACYTQAASIVCDPTAGEDIIVLHTHDALCYQEDVLLCTLQEQEGHLHTDDCYETVVTPAHTHDESCMTRERGTQLCQLEEIEGHTHGDTCFAPGINLQCAEEEREGHSHGEACYEAQDVLNCAEAENPEHVHDETCYTQVSNLICELQEEPGHSHTDQCYELIQICDQEEIEGHAHTDECFEMVETLGCGLEENPEEIVEKNLCCTLMELAPHTHSEGCFDENGQQICTILNATEHQHTEECIQVSQNEENLICEKEVHEHILECYSNPEADLETAADWEATFAQAERSGVWREDALTIAKTQLGYNESTKNYIVEEGDEIKGYTRYGAWYGIPYGDWCAMYASFCLHYAGVEGMPLDASCPKWISALSQLNLYHSEDSYVPVSGDLIFFDWDTDADADHVGLVVETDGEKVKTIEGNNGDTVAYHDYKLSDSRIMGYGALPVQVPEQEETGSWNCGMTAHTHGEGCYDQDKLTCQTSEHIHDEDCKNKQLFYSDDTLRAFVTIKGVEELPQDLSVRVWQVDPDTDSDTYLAMHSALEEQLDTNTQFISQMNCYGMELLSEDAVYLLPETAQIETRVEFTEPVFTAEQIEESTQMGTYQLTEAEAISTFSSRSEPEAGVAYQAEIVEEQQFDSSDEGLTALDFQSNNITTFAVMLTAENPNGGNYWEKVTEFADIADTVNENGTTKKSTYLIVSAEGNYALTGDSTANSEAVTLQTVKGNPQYYTISYSNGNSLNMDIDAKDNGDKKLYWTIQKNGSSYTIQNVGITSSYLGLTQNNQKFTLLTNSGQNLTLRTDDPSKKYETAKDCWWISNGGYLRNSGNGNAFVVNNGNDGNNLYNNNSVNAGTQNTSVTYYHTRDMLIFKLVTENLNIPNDVTAGGNNNESGTPTVPEDPEFPEFVDTSGGKTGNTSLTGTIENTAITNTVNGQYYSDPSSSNLEQFFRPEVSDLTSDEAYAASKINDGKVMTDKSVIYGADDYGAFSKDDYAPNTFGVTLSALGQEYPIHDEEVVTTPIDVVFVLDVSGSMSKNTTSNAQETRIDALRNAFNVAATHILGDAQKQNRIGVAIYSTGAWEMLPLGRYEAETQNGVTEFLKITTDYQKKYNNKNIRISDIHYLWTSDKLRPEGQPNNTTYANIGKGRDINGDEIIQGIGTYTQAGIAMGYKIFADNTNTTYTVTVGSGANERQETIQRQPVFILLSDGEPTHATNIYMDPLSGPHYSNGMASTGSANISGVQGYYTVLSANYFKRMAGIHYQKPAMFYTIGMGIKSPDEENDDESYTRYDSKGNETQGTGDKYKRAVLNPTLANVNDVDSVKTNDTTERVALEFKSMMQGGFTDQAQQTLVGWPDPWYGVPHAFIPVLKQNPYAGQYSYADDAFFGQMSTNDLNEAFDKILEQSFSETSYGFVLYEHSSVKMNDIIGAGMQIKGNPVLRYNGTNYRLADNYVPKTGTDTFTDKNGNTYTEEYKQYIYSSNDANKEKLARITVKVYKQADGKQRVFMEVPDSALPVYSPEIIAHQYYYEALPVRLIYQVGLTPESEQAVLTLEPGKSLTFYTNDFSYVLDENGQHVINKNGNPIVDSGADSVLTPSFHNPYYYNETDEGKTPHQPHHSPKDTNTTDTADHHVDCKRTIKTTADNTSYIEVTHDLGNNGKLVFSVETVDVPVEKKWTGVNADSQAPITVSLYQVTQKGDNYFGTLVEGKTLTLDKQSWKGAFEDVALPTAESEWFYAVAEAKPNGFVASYGENEISMSVNNGAPMNASKVTFDEKGKPILVVVTNSPQVTLPETGGPGTILYTTGGLLLMMAAFLLLLHKQTNKRRKEDIPSF